MPKIESSTPVITLILPCYNEEKSVSNLAESLSKFKFQYPDFHLETVVVNDGSSDGTANALMTFKQFDRVHTHPGNLGYGAAIKSGLKHSKSPWIAFMDFDGTCNPMDLPKLLSLAQRENADMVMGHRLHSASEMPLVRRVGNQLYSWALKLLFLFTAPPRSVPEDVCTGFRVLKSDCAQDLFPKLPNDLSFSPALTGLALKNKYRIYQHPIDYSERLGTSKLSVVGDGFKFLFTLIRYSKFVR